MNCVISMMRVSSAALPPWLPWLLVAAVGLFGSMIFSGMETGFYVLSRPRLQLRGWKKDTAALRLNQWIKKPAGPLAGLLIWQNICNFMVSAGVAELIRQRQYSPTVQTLLSALIVLPLMLIFAEILPKDLFLTHADDWTYRLSRLLSWSLMVITVLPVLPLLRVLDFLTRRVIGHMLESPQVDPPPRLLAFTAEPTATGVLTDTQQDLIQRGLRIAHIHVREVMMPWNRVIGVPVNISRRGFEAMVRHYHVSRMPVLGRSAQDVLGLVDVIDAIGSSGELQLRQHLKPALTLLGEQSVRTAIRLMQAARQTIAVVVNRQGQAIGLVTMKDLVEELLGDLQSW